MFLGKPRFVPKSIMGGVATSQNRYNAGTNINNNKNNFIMEQIFNRLREEGVTVTPQMKAKIYNQVNICLVPTPAIRAINTISKKKLKTINQDTDLAKDVLFKILSNLSFTYYRAKESNDFYEIQGYKQLHNKILQEQIQLSSKTYVLALKLLISEGLIEKGRNYRKGVRSNEYRLINIFFTGKLSKYEYKSNHIKEVNLNFVKGQLGDMFTNPIAKNELLNYHLIQFPNEVQVKEHLIKKAKEGYTNKQGKRLVYLNKRNRDNFKDCVFVEDYIQQQKYLQRLIFPIISDNGRVYTAFNLTPTVIKDIITIFDSPITEIDYCSIMPNVLQNIYGGKNQEEITHDKVANILGISRDKAKLAHLTYFNLEVHKMRFNPVNKYYMENEPEMMRNILKCKENNGYKQISRNYFKAEVELMNKNVVDADFVILYCFDAFYVMEKDANKCRSIMNKNSKLFGYHTTA